MAPKSTKRNAATIDLISPSALATPQVKRSKTNSLATPTPNGKAKVGKKNLKFDDGAITPTPVKKGGSSSSSFSSSLTTNLFKSSSIQSPTTAQQYIPKHIHKNLVYTRASPESYDALSPQERKAFDNVVSTYVVPENFENERKYGPLSGLDYFKRVISAYSCGFLELKSALEEEGRKGVICVCCGNEGHLHRNCPEGF